MSVSLTTSHRTQLLHPLPPIDLASSPSTASTVVTASQRRRPRSTGPLKGVVAIVDVRVGTDAQIDCSDVVARKLRELGASTVKRFTSKLTHVVLSHFTSWWKTKIAKWQTGGSSMAVAATRYDLKIVSQLWVNACYVSTKKMEERPFFPVSQYNAVETVGAKDKMKLKRRQSVGLKTCILSADEQDQDQGAKDDTEVIETIPSRVTPLTPTFRIVKELNSDRKRQRALSMEPMTSDAILQMLGKTETSSGVVDITTPKQPIRLKRVSSSTKRRKTLNGPLSQQDEDEVTVSHDANGIVAESESENEKENETKEKQDDVIMMEDDHATRPSPVMLKNDKVSVDLLNVSTTSTISSEKFGTLSDTVSKKKEPTARELRRRNRTSLSYGSGLTLKSGIWSCAVCGCSNPRTRSCCTECQSLKGSAKCLSADTTNSASSVADAKSVADSPEALILSSIATSSPATLRTKATTLAKKTSTPSFANRRKMSISGSLFMSERTQRRSLTRTKSSLDVKACSSSLLASRDTRAASKTSIHSPATRLNIKNSASRCSASKQTPRSSLASASVSADVQEQRLDAHRRLATVTSASSAMQLTQSAAKKRVYTPVSSNALMTPVVKKARRDNKETMADKYVATPGSVSGFLRKHRDVNSTPIPMAMQFSATRKTPRKIQRNIISITGVSAETRGVLQCAIHAIDANMSNDPGHRKARVVKSVDYTAGVTHLVVGKDARRTIKVLFAIARGAWIVSEDWVFMSLVQERWLPEEDYELTMFANKYAREHTEYRQIFKDMKVYIGSNVEPSREVLQSLVQIASGEICNQVSLADICICGDVSLFRRAQRIGIRAVTSKWVFDSIAALKLEDDANYMFAEALDTSIKPLVNIVRAAVPGLEAHSTVLE